MLTIDVGGPIGVGTTQLLGVNLESLEHAASSNLYDWLADAGAGIARILHPDRCLRASGRIGAWGHVASESDVAALRQAFRDDPAPVLAGEDLATDRHLTWIGTTDIAVSRLRSAGVEPLPSTGYTPADGPGRLDADGAEGFRARAACWAYHAAFFLHFQRKHGCTRFLLTNEPELSGHKYHHTGAAPTFSRLVEVMLRDPTGIHSAEREALLAVINAQHRHLVACARLAADDVAAITGLRPILAGPASLRPLDLAESVAGQVEIFDWHHYTPDPAVLRQRWADCANRNPGVAALALSEFNRRSGPTAADEGYFVHRNCLEFAEIGLAVLGLPRPATADRPADPPAAWACLYCFNHPATHRNNKQLVYGDLNCADLSSADTALRDLPAECHPSAEAQQIRHATAAHDIFALLVRFAGRQRLSVESPVPVLAVNQPDGVSIAVINRETNPRSITVPFQRSGSWWCRAVSRRLRDQCVAASTQTGPVTIELPAESVCEIRICDRPQTTSLHLIERGTGPGRIADLPPLATTRLAAIGDGNIDLTTGPVVWSVSHPGLVQVTQRGLVQRLLRTIQTVTVTARTWDGRLAASAVLPPCP
ncbi:hypothetical protein LBMAG53_08430 [Planctomycetota bacterium]|nr:hypothetical protein LBMAG53_08430 [Planctomycetota bacterium]